MSFSVRRVAPLVLLGLMLAAGLVVAMASGGSSSGATTPFIPVHPLVSDYAQVTHSETPPTQAQCISVGRRCFTPQSTRAAYNVNPLYAQGFDGTGKTIAIVDSYGSDTMAHDLHVYDQAFDLPPMCGEEGVACTPGMPKFSQLSLQGSPATKAQPGKGTHQEDKSAWALEVALDVEVAHSIAPDANILLVHTPTAETLGVQGLPQMMSAEQYVVDHGLADVITQSFGTAEKAFSSYQSLRNLRHAFISAEQKHVTVLASSGDDGSAGFTKQPVAKGGALIDTPTVGWPASDPLVTGVGGTYLCADATNTTTRTLDNVNPPVNCQSPNDQVEVGWIASGGGFSDVFSRPSYQETLPDGSTAIPETARGVPDVGLQASSRTGALVYLSLPPDGESGLKCGDKPCSTGWYDIGGTSLSSPEWAGLVAIADEIKGSDVGFMNPTLYSLAAQPATYGKDFFDVTTGDNGAEAPDIPGYPATTGWDPVTGLGTPNAAELLPDLAANSG